MSTAQFFDFDTCAFSGAIAIGEGLAVTSAAFHEHAEGDNKAIVIGCARNLRFHPRACDGGQLVLLNLEGEVVQSTDIEDIPGAIGRFGDFILCGIGRIVRLYRLGRRHLLKQTESRTIPFHINFVSSVGLRIIVGDAAESFHFLKFDPVTGVITPFCDDATPRFPIASILLDSSTVACGDRFGNFTVLALPTGVGQDADIDPSGVGMVWEHPGMCGSPNKVDIATMFHVGDLITGLTLSNTGECLFWGTVGGQIGAMIPFRDPLEWRLCRRLENELRDQQKGVCGRVHLMYRSYSAPVKNVCDGDLLMMFLEMSDEEQERIAAQIQSTRFNICTLLASFETCI
jgi:splicing factor 3B subunit 3